MLFIFSSAIMLYFFRALFVVKVNHQLITTKENSRSLSSKKNIQNMLSGGFATNNTWIVQTRETISKKKQYFHSKVTGLTNQGIGLGIFHVSDIIAFQKRSPDFFMNPQKPWRMCPFHPGNYQIEISNM